MTTLLPEWDQRGAPILEGSSLDGDLMVVYESEDAFVLVQKGSEELQFAWAQLYDKSVAMMIPTLRPLGIMVKMFTYMAALVVPPMAFTPAVIAAGLREYEAGLWSFEETEEIWGAKWKRFEAAKGREQQD